MSRDRPKSSMCRRFHAVSASTSYKTFSHKMLHFVSRRTVLCHFENNMYAGEKLHHTDWATHIHTRTQTQVEILAWLGFALFFIFLIQNDTPKKFIPIGMVVCPKYQYTHTHNTLLDAHIVWCKKWVGFFPRRFRFFILYFLLFCTGLFRCQSKILKKKNRRIAIEFFSYWTESIFHSLTLPVSFKFYERKNKTHKFLVLLFQKKKCHPISSLLSNKNFLIWTTQ